MLDATIREMLFGGSCLISTAIVAISKFTMRSYFVFKSLLMVPSRYNSLVFTNLVCFFDIIPFFVLKLHLCVRLCSISFKEASKVQFTYGLLKSYHHCLVQRSSTYGARL